jgi:hypothetical protein
MRFGFRVLVRFTPLWNAWLWVPQGPYPKFDLQQTHFLHTTQIPWSFKDLLLRWAAKQSKLVINVEKISIDLTYRQNTKTVHKNCPWTAIVFEGGWGWLRCSMDNWDVLWTVIRGAHMCDMEGPIVGHCNPEQVLDRARWGVFRVLWYLISTNVFLVLRRTAGWAV